MVEADAAHWPRTAQAVLNLDSRYQRKSAKPEALRRIVIIADPKAQERALAYNWCDGRTYGTTQGKG